MYSFVNNIKIKKVENFDKRMDITRPVYLPSHYRTQDVSKYSSLGTALAPFYTSRVLNPQVNNVIPKWNLRNTFSYSTPCIMIPIHFRHFRRRVCEYPVIPEIGYPMGHNFLCFTTFIKGAFEKKGKRASFKKDQQLFPSKTSENCEKNFLSQVPPRY